MNQLQFGIIVSIYFIFIFLCIMFSYIYMWNKKGKLDKDIIEAIKNSIKHHKRMQKWVRKQDTTLLPSNYVMEDQINESWFVGDCPLCQLFFNNGRCRNNKDIICPLYEKYGNCNDNYSDNVWMNTADSFSWKEWLKWDKKLVKQLKSLLN